MSHLRAINFIQHMSQLTPGQKATLAKELDRLGNNGLDWNAAVTRELSLREKDWNGPVTLQAFIQSYVAVVNDASTFPKFQQLDASLPAKLRNEIPNPKAFAEHKQALSEKLSQVRTSLQ
jgi:hypothetical protein